MTVTWTTFVPAESMVKFGLVQGKALTQSAKGGAKKFVDGGKLQRTLFIHRVTLSDLLPGQSYGKGRKSLLSGGRPPDRPQLGGLAGEGGNPATALMPRRALPLQPIAVGVGRAGATPSPSVPCRTAATGAPALSSMGTWAW